MADTPSDPLPVDPTTRASSAPRKAWRGALISSIRHDARGSSQDHSRRAAEMRKRLADPQLREQLRLEQRTQIDAMHPDLAQVVGLDSRTASELIELLTDQQMSVFDRIHGDELQAPNSVAMQDRVARNAREGTRRIEEIRSLLGEQGFERYRDYQSTLRERLQVALFEEHLSPGEELTPEQKNRLMSLLRWQEEQRQRHMLENRHLVPPAVHDHEALRKQNMAANEKSFWRMQKESQLLISRTAEVLTQRQIDVFARMEAEEIDAYRRHLEQLRVDAGMSREIPSPAEADEDPGRQPIRGQVRRGPGIGSRCLWALPRSATTISGSKVYAIELDARVTPVEQQ